MMDGIHKFSSVQSNVSGIHNAQGQSSISANTQGNTPSAISSSNKPHVPMTQPSAGSTLPKADGGANKDFTFSGPLKMLNNMSPANQAAFIKENGEDLMGNAKIVGQLGDWLGKKATQVTSINDSVAAPVYEAIKENFSTLKDVAATGDKQKDAVGKFMAEALRSYNFSNHDPAVIRDFVNKFQEMNIPIHGNPELCERETSFDQLGYTPNYGLTMKLG